MIKDNRMVIVKIYQDKEVASFGWFYSVKREGSIMHNHHGYCMFKRNAVRVANRFARRMTAVNKQETWTV